MRIQIYRVVDYDRFIESGDVILIRDYIVLDQTSGILIVSDLQYNGNIEENGFELSNVNLEGSGAQVEVFNEDEMHHFDDRLDKWWNEDFYAIQIQLTGIDKILNKAIDNNSQKIIRAIFKS